MKNNLINNSLVLFITLLFLGASIIPIINGEKNIITKYQNIKDNVTTSLTNSFSSDQYIDLATTGYSDDELNILLNDGGGGFNNRHDYPSRLHPNWIDAADFNSDGYIDIVTCHSSESYFCVYFNDGAGSFNNRQDYSSDSPNGVAAGDFDNDGDQDLAIAEEMAKIFYNDGSGNFLNPQEYDAGWNLDDMITADFNNDGNLDLATCNFAQDISIIYGLGDGSFGSPHSYPTSDWAKKLYAADMNNDGYIDIGVAMRFEPYIDILINKKNGGFSLNEYDAKSWPHSIVLADFDEDGYNDAAAVMHWDDEVGVWLNDGTGELLTPNYYSISNSPADITTGDFDNDGHLDLASVCESYDKISIIYGDGNGDFSNCQNYDTGGSPKCIVAANFNPDGGMIPPHAEFDWSPNQPTEDQIVYFDATDSFDPDGTTISYDWDFGDGNSGTGETPNHIYSQEGVYNVVLTVTDNDGLQDSINKQITINGDNNPPYKPNIPSGPSTGELDIPYTFSTSTTDPEEDDIKFGWDWDGDNTIDEWTNYYESGETCTIQHSWPNPGTYEIKVKAKDTQGAQSEFSNPLTFTIPDGGDNEPPNTPNTPLGPTTGEINVPYAFSTSTTDPEEDDIKFGWDWDGDNTIDEWTDYYPSGETCSSIHSWQNPGTYEIKVKAKDTQGAQSEFSNPLTISITGINKRPTVEITDPTQGQTITGVYTIRGEADDEDGYVTNVQIKIDDGNWQTCTGTYSWSKSWDTTQYENGPHTIYAQSYDGEDYSDFDTVTLEVYNPPENQAEKPNLTTNDEWYYTINPLKIHLGEYLTFNSKIPELNLWVKSTTGSYYTLEFYAELPTDDEATVKVFLSTDKFENLNQNTTFEGHLYGKVFGSQKPYIEGTIKLDKQTLGLYEISFYVWTRIGFSKALAVPIDCSGIIKPETIYDHYQFPIIEDETWDVPRKKFNVDLKVGIPGIEKKLSHAFDINISSHTSECVGIEKINGYDTYHVKNLDDDTEYWYSADKKAALKAEGLFVLWRDTDYNPDGYVEFSANLDACPPNRPSRPAGESKPKAGRTYSYSTSTTDPNNDQISYGWDWNGDKIVDEWTSYYDSGDTCTIKHQWTTQELKEGSVNIYVRAKDTNEELSGWSESLTISKTRTKSSYSNIINIIEKLLQKYPVILWILENIKDSQIKLFN